MSLQLAAQHMASRGRGPDNTLVHMAPQEVAGLQALAKAHGGTLTINPETGLPEAGFLSNILPTLIGVGLSVASGGTLTPLMAAGITGAGYGVATGSLRKGLMAGLGAYGGAGLAGSVMGAGTAAGTAAAAGEAAAAGNLASQSALAEANLAQSAIANAAPSANALASATPEFSAFNATQSLPGAFGEAAGSYVPPTQAANIIPTTVSMPTIPTGNITAEQMLKAGFTPEQIAQSAEEYAANTAGNASNPFTAKTQEMLSSPAKSGISAIMDKPELLFNKENMKYGLAAAAPLLFQEQEKKARKEEKPYEYTFNYNRVEEPSSGYTGPYTGERTYFNPTFTRTAAGGGLMDIGPVEAMSNRNEAETLMANGGQMFAEGGETKAVAPVEANPYYTMTGQSGDAFKYLMGQGPKTAPATAGPKAEPPTAPVDVIAPPALFAADSANQGMIERLLSGSPQAQQTVVATPMSLASATGDLENSYTFNPATGMFTSIASAAKASPTVAANYLSGGDSSAQSTLTPQQIAVFDFMNTPAGQSYKDAFGAANSRAIGSFMPGSIFTGNFSNPFTALRDANSAYSAAEEAARADRIGNLPTGYEGVGGPGTYSGSVSDPSQSYGGGDTTSASSADSTAADNSGVGGWAYGGLMALAGGGQSHLGDYSDGGRLLRGPGDGVSDSIPASIGNKRPARLADGEFVVPARIVSELGNGSTEAGARKLYAMMDRVQKARGKTVGKGRVAVNSKAEKMLPA